MISSKKITRLMASALLFAGCSSAVHAVTYDLVNDFSNISNPNGVWSFTQGNTPLPHQNSLTPHPFNPAVVDGYWGAGSNLSINTPEVIKTTADASTLGIGMTDEEFLAGDVILHSTNPGSGLALQINWTAPDDGVIDFSASTWYAHLPVNRSNDLTIYLDGVFLDSGVLNATIRRSNALVFGGTGLTVDAGDVLSFIYTPSAGQIHGSVAGIIETVEFSAVPVPAAVWLFGSGLLGIIGFARRKK